MAVVQISKIQVRRGRKSQSNIPQLSSGEFGWAVDTQQLYIGNGSVAEGAPFVGNTEVLTENSNIFELLGAYTYKAGDIQTGVDSNTPFSRSLQQKLDDVVNVRDFGAVGDFSGGIGTDNTASIQRAIDQLYLNTANKESETSRVSLHLPAGVYKITSALNIPSNVTLIGDGIDKTVIYQSNGEFNIFKTVASSSTPGNYIDSSNGINDVNSPRRVSIKGITFKRNPGATVQKPIGVLDCLSDSLFEQCKFEGNWMNGTGEEKSPVIPGSSSCILAKGLGTVTTQRVLFLNCVFEKTTHAVYCDFDTDFLTFRNCEFLNLFRAFTLAKTSVNVAGQNFGPQNYLIEGSKFDNIDAEAIKVFTNSNSKGHRSINNKYLDVGNNNLGQSQPYRPILDMRVPNCQSINDYFQRNIDVNDIDLNKTGSPSNFIAYIPDVLGVSDLEYGPRTVTLFSATQVSNPRLLLKAPVWSSCQVIIEYTMRRPSSSLYRSGTMSINVHPNMAGSIILTPNIVDDFTYSGEDVTIGTAVGGNILFFAKVENFSSVTYDPVTLNSSIVLRPTLILQYSNPLGPNSNATFTYKMKIVSGNSDYIET
jgi:hypothetical protein